MLLGVFALASVAHASVPPSILLSDEEIRRFHQDGYKIIRKAIPEADINRLALHRPQHPFSWWLRPLELLLDQISSRYLTWDGLWLEQRQYRSFWLSGGGHALAPMVASLMQENQTDGTVRLLTDIIYGIKKGYAPFVLREWHTDLESFDILTPESAGISIWIPLSDIDHQVNGGSLLVVNNSLVDSEQCGGEQPGIVSNRCNSHLDAIGTTYSFKKGDAIVFTRSTYHKTQLWRHSTVDSDRFALVGRFTSGAARYHKPTLEGFQKKNTCRHGLQDTALLRSPCFPQIFPATLAQEIASIERGGVSVDSTDLHLFKSCLSKVPLYFTLFWRNIWQWVLAGRVGVEASAGAGAPLALQQRKQQKEQAEGQQQQGPAAGTGEL